MGLAAGEHVAAAGVRRRVERLREKWHFQLLSSFEHTHTVTHTLSTKLSHKHHRNTPGHNTAQNRTHQFTRPNVSTTTATQMMHEANQFLSPSEQTPSELPSSRIDPHFQSIPSSLPTCPPLLTLLVLPPKLVS